MLGIAILLVFFRLALTATYAGLVLAHLVVTLPYVVRIVATSIGEEGLDIPQVDLVVFYEPVPSEIRTIQRRGRTGRSAAGRVVMLVTKDTRDEAYFYSARRKERKMHQELDRLRKELRQKIFVGQPGGETFVAADPERRIESLREETREERPQTVLPRPAAKKGQTKFEDF